MHETNMTKKPVPPQVVWIVWGAMCMGLPVIQFFMGGGTPKIEEGATIPVIIVVPLILVMAATVVRWLVIPRLTTNIQRFQAMVVGVALAEAAEFLGVFMISSDSPTSMVIVFPLAFLGMLQFAPVYALEDEVK